MFQKPKDINNDCIKYCLLKKKTNHREDAIIKISKALLKCDMSDESINDAIILLKALL